LGKKTFREQAYDSDSKPHVSPQHEDLNPNKKTLAPATKNLPADERTLLI